MSIKLGPLKDRGSELSAFLEEKIGMKPVLEGDTIEFGEGSRNKYIKTYLKRFLHREGIRKQYRILSEKGIISLIETRFEKEEES